MSPSPSSKPVAVDGGLTVPGNRWDLVSDAVASARHGPIRPFALIVSYYRQPRQLQFLYTALACVGLDDRTEVVIVDDGSDEPPPPPPPGVSARILRQRDLGFRPAAARNLGVRSTTANALVFLDADTIPDARCLAALAAWPAVLPDALVVGTRHHVDLSAMSDEHRAHWLTHHNGPPPEPFEEPVWLADGYRQSRDLLDADDRSYRYIISGVMACHRRLFDDLGGFDPSIRVYAGEDWDLAYRAFNNGAILVHEPRAVTWHDGPAWGERSPDTHARNAETLRLAERIPVPGSRVPGAVHQWPDLVVQAHLGPDHEAAVVVATISSILAAAADVHIYLDDDQDPAVAAFFRHDPRIRFGDVPTAVARRGRVLIAIEQPVGFQPGALARLTRAVRPDGVGCVHVCVDGIAIATVSSTRALGRLRRCGAPEPNALMATLFGERTVDAAAAGVTLLAPNIDLPHFIDRLVQATNAVRTA